MNKSDLKVGMKVVINQGALIGDNLKHGDTLVFLAEGTSQGGYFETTGGEKVYMRWTEVSPVPQPVTMNNTPATRKGIQVGDQVVSANTGNRYTLISDDGSDHPLFRSDSSGNEINVYLGYVGKIEVANVDKLFVGKAITVTVDLRTPAQKAGIEVGDYVRGNASGSYFQITDINDGNRLIMRSLNSGRTDIKNTVAWLTKVTEEEAKAATTPSALKGWKVGDYFEITGGSYGKVGDVIKMTRDSGSCRDNHYVNTITGEELWKDHGYVRKLSVAEAEAKIAELKKTPLERAGFKIGDKVVYKNVLLTITDGGRAAIYADDENGAPWCISVEEAQKYDGDYCKLVGLNVGDIVISKGSRVMRDGDYGVLRAKEGSNEIAESGQDTVEVTTEHCGICYPSVKYLRKATKAEVIQYLQNATGTVGADIVKFALA